MRASDIAAYFGVNASTAGQKAAKIRDLKMLEETPEFATQEMIAYQVHMQDTMLQTFRAMMPDVDPEILASELDSFLMGGDSLLPGEFVDDDRDAMQEYYDLCKLCGPAGPTPEMEDAVREVIKSDRYFLDSYLMLVEILKRQDRVAEAQKVLDKAYVRALKLITKETGQWPEALRWGWLENRHIIRTVFNKAIDSWAKNQPSETSRSFATYSGAPPTIRREQGIPYSRFGCV